MFLGFSNTLPHPKSAISPSIAFDVRKYPLFSSTQPFPSFHYRNRLRRIQSTQEFTTRCRSRLVSHTWLIPSDDSFRHNRPRKSGWVFVRSFHKQCYFECRSQLSFASFREMVKWRSAITKRVWRLSPFWIDFTGSCWQDQLLQCVLAEGFDNGAVFWWFSLFL
jgi:hypothetical protein